MDIIRETKPAVPAVKSRTHRLVILLCALIFSFLFHRSYPGINVLLYELLLVIATVSVFPENRWTRLRVLVTAGMLLTAMAYMLFRPGWTLFVNVLALLSFVGISMAPEVRSLFTGVKLSLQNVPYGFIKWVDDLRQRRRVRGSFAFRLFRFYYMLVPAVIIALFIIIYRFANPVFDDYMGELFSNIGHWIGRVFDHIDFVWVMMLLLGFVFSSFALVHVLDRQMIHRDSIALDTLKRVRGRMMKGVSSMGLKNEWRAGLFLLITLNTLILLLNAIDLYWVWFNFEWRGQYLKDFVHEGTYLLIFSMIISMGIVLYFFRKNLNFFSRNVWLKRLCYLWLAQNAFLALSVAVRNWRYIEHFALAYKRIGVFFFLAAVLLGIITIIIKVSQRKTTFYLFRTNALAAYVIILLSALVPWDLLIANYNFRHYDRSFLHFDYLSTLSPTALPALDKELSELRAMQVRQDVLFPFEEAYMSADEYHDVIREKKQAFKERFEQKTWQEWTWAEQRAYNYVSKQ